jgi:serine/threonine protein kinase
VSRPESLLGQQIDGYRLTKLLGSGRVADVYEAWTPAGEQVAFKLLRPDPGHDGGPSEGPPNPPGNGGKAHARLVQEAEALATIRHVNVVGFRGGGLFQGRLWILVDLVDGSDLRKRAGAPGGLPLEQLLEFVRQACEGVAAAHRKGIFHRDLKPENILITSQDVVKVADFGSAKLASLGVQTTAQEQVSSALYRAPESVRLRVSGPESDVFSIGVILYELLSGTHPIGDETLSVMAVCQRLLVYAPPPPLATLGRGIPFDVSDLVQRALSPEPAQRDSMQALANALEAAQQRLLARKRADAQSLPVPGQEVGMARTELQMPQMGVSGGTIPMAQAAPPERPTTLPPVPAGPVTAPSEMRRALAPTVAMALPEPGSPDDRRSTGIPVEKAGPRPSAAGASAASRRRLSLVVTASAVVVGAGLAVTGWVLSGSPPSPVPATAAAPPRASASAASPGSASAAAPRTAPPGGRGTGKKTRP